MDMCQKLCSFTCLRLCDGPGRSRIMNCYAKPLFHEILLIACRKQRPCVAHAADNSASVVMPKPVIKIDNSTDPFATVVKVEFGDRLGELLDTVRHPSHSLIGTHNESLGSQFELNVPHGRVSMQIQGLKNMGYNISRAKLSEGSKNKFFITNAKTSEKVSKSAEV